MHSCNFIQTKRDAGTLVPGKSVVDLHLECSFGKEQDEGIN